MGQTMSENDSQILIYQTDDNSIKVDVHLEDESVWLTQAQMAMLFDKINELQTRIREIRLSERFFYQKIKDIYMTSIDYDPGDENTIRFFKLVQNKLLWAISQQTAAELVYRKTLCQ